MGMQGEDGRLLAIVLTGRKKGSCLGRRGASQGERHIGG